MKAKIFLLAAIFWQALPSVNAQETAVDVQMAAAKSQMGTVVRQRELAEFSEHDANVSARTPSPLWGGSGWGCISFVFF